MSATSGRRGLIFVADGTRRETFDQLYELRNVTVNAIGEVPSLVALNKQDLTDAWVLRDEDYESLKRDGWHTLRTSAKTGDGVEEAFAWIAQATLA